MVHDEVFDVSELVVASRSRMQVIVMEADPVGCASSHASTRGLCQRCPFKLRVVLRVVEPRGPIIT